MRELWRFFGAVAVVVVAAVMFGLARQQTVNWGSVADWFAAGGTIFAACVAIYLAGEPERQRRRAEREAAREALGELLASVDLIIERCDWALSAYADGVGPTWEQTSAHFEQVGAALAHIDAFDFDLLSSDARRIWHLLAIIVQRIGKDIRHMPQGAWNPGSYGQWASEIRPALSKAKERRNLLAATR